MSFRLSNEYESDFRNDEHCLRSSEKKAQKDLGLHGIWTQTGGRGNYSSRSLAQLVEHCSGIAKVIVICTLHFLNLHVWLPTQTWLIGVQVTPESYSIQLILYPKSQFTHFFLLIMMTL